MTTTESRPEAQAGSRRLLWGLGASFDARQEARQRKLEAALLALARLTGPLYVGPLYSSEAISPIPQPDFLNTVAIGSSELEAEALLGIAKALERAAGRQRSTERFTPRPLDVDLLWVEGTQSHRPELTLPHPGLRHRAFVLAPLAELAPNFEVPPDNLPITDCLESLLAQQQVTRLDWDLSGVKLEG